MKAYLQGRKATLRLVTLVVRIGLVTGVRLSVGGFSQVSLQVFSLSNITLNLVPRGATTIQNDKTTDAEETEY
jgi:hypothetical protein